MKLTRSRNKYQYNLEIYQESVDIKRNLMYPHSMRGVLFYGSKLQQALEVVD